MAKWIALNFPSAACSFSSCYPIPTLRNPPRMQRNRRWTCAVWTESFTKFQRDILLPVTPQLICSLASSWILYSANSTVVTNCDYANVKWQKSCPEHIGKICIMHMPEASLLPLGIPLHSWPALPTRQYHAGTHIFNSCHWHRLGHLLSSALPWLSGFIFLKFSAFIHFAPQRTEEFISGFMRIIV